MPRLTFGADVSDNRLSRARNLCGEHKGWWDRAALLSSGWPDTGRFISTLTKPRACPTRPVTAPPEK